MKALKNFPTRVQSTAQTAGDVFKWTVVDRTSPGTAINSLTLPADLVPIHISIQNMGSSNSNAGTTATISMGFKGGSGTELMAAQDVKTNANILVPANIANLIVASPTTASTFADKQLTVTYAETGAASTAGGPWLVAIECMSNPYR